MGLSRLNDLEILGQLYVREFMNKATLTTEGVVQLTSDLNNVSETLALTAKGAKVLNDAINDRVKKAGDTMTGVLSLFSGANLLHATNKMSINAQDSAIGNINQLIFSNHATSVSGMGILFLKTDKIAGSTNVADYDKMRIHNSIPYFNDFELIYQNPVSKDTSYYTKTGTDNAITAALAQLVDGSQETLNTLKELADAIGNDPDFAANIATEVAKKLPKAGGTMTGDIILENAVKLIFQDIDSFIHKYNNDTILYSTTGAGGHLFNNNVSVEGDIYTLKTVDGNVIKSKVWTVDTFNPSEYFKKSDDFEITGPIINNGVAGVSNTILDFGSHTPTVPETDYYWNINYLGANSGVAGNQFELKSNIGASLLFDHQGDLRVSRDIYTNGDRKVWDSESWKPDAYLGAISIIQLGQYISLGDHTGAGPSDFGIVDLSGEIQSKLLIHNVPTGETAKLLSMELSTNSGTLFTEMMTLLQNGLLKIKGGVETTEYKFSESNSKIAYNKVTNCLEFIVKR
jgi:hypothetical protein